MSLSAVPCLPRLGAADRLCPPLWRRPGGVSRQGFVSLGLHLLVLALLMISLVRRPISDSSPPAAVAVVFEGGPRSAAPQTQDSRRSAPTRAPDPRQTRNLPPGAAPPAPARTAASATPPATPPAIPRATPPATPPASAPPVASPLLPRAAQGLPRLSARAARPQAAAPASPFSALSSPMTLSLAGRPPPVASKGRLSRGIDMTMAPTAQNRNVMTRYAEARRRLGEDWWGAFSRFVEEHKYYPLHAAENGLDGQSVLRLKVARDGTVESVRIELSSGSPELDMAWISVFRGNKVPPFPPGTIEDDFSFSASMTYILERQ